MATPTLLKTPIVRGADLANELDDDLSAAAALNHLAYWIAQARQLIDSVRHAAERDQELGAALSSKGVRIYAASWGDADDEGLQYLGSEIMGKLQSMRSFVDRATSHAREQQ